MNGEFRWETYLKQKRAFAAPSTTFYMSSVLGPESRSSSAVEDIEVGMKLEITDRANPDAFRVATVIDIVGRLGLGFALDARNTIGFAIHKHIVLSSAICYILPCVNYMN